VRVSTITMEERKKIIAAYKSGNTLREIAVLVDRGYGTVQRVVRESGIRRRPKGWPKGKRKKTEE
jgi:IS30 family transposase